MDSVSINAPEDSGTFDNWTTDYGTEIITNNKQHLARYP